MDDGSGRGGAVVFGPFRFDPAKRELRRAGRLVALPRKAFDVLAMLVERDGAAVSRAELYERLWAEGAVEDGNLTQTIYLLRRALDPAGDGRSYVETLPRFGYRFACGVRRAAPQRAQHSWPRTLRAAVLVLAASALVSGASSGTARPLTAEASTAFALGQFHLDMRGRDNLRRSVEYFQRTVHAAPASGLGYAGLAAAHGLLAEFEPERSPRFDAELALAKRMQAEAVRRDPSNADAHAVGGFIACRFDGDVTRAEREFRAALSSDERNAMAHHWYGVFLMTRNQLGAAVAEFELAHRLQPTSEVFLRWLARGYMYQGRYADAERAFEETLAIRPSDGAALIGVAAALEGQRRFGGALRALRDAARLVPYERAYAVPAEARIALRAGRRVRGPRTSASFERLLRSNAIDGAETALYYLATRDRARALTALRYARRGSAIDRAVIRLDPRFAALRGDVRFRRLVGGPFV